MISISIALSRINITYDENNRPVVFSVKFVKDDGSIRTIEKARKSVKHATIGGGRSERAPGKFKYNLKERGVIMLYDTQAKEKNKQFRSVKISSIIEFNGQPVHH
jgi:hypothetical protein